jgi:tetratricopeptide (TPR) repeat protein
MHWEQGREAMRRSAEFAKAGEPEQALSIVEDAISEATKDQRKDWIYLLCGHAAVLADAMGDTRRKIRYVQQALPHAQDYQFAAYNFARLLLDDGQLELAKQYAAEAYQLATAKGTQADSDLKKAILELWPSISEK